MTSGRASLPTMLLAMLCVGVIGLAAPRVSAANDGPASTDGVAFVRVFGTARGDVKGDLEDPEVVDDIELATGSGFAISPAGLVVTNHHVIAGARHVGFINGHEAELVLEATRIEVSLWRGGTSETYDASVVASDADLDLAVLQITAVDAPYVPLGDSDAIQPGQGVTVVGFPFGAAVEVGRSAGPGLVPSPSVTSGSLAAARADDEGRTRYLQTDATVNPGSSGGPILDQDGYAVGVVRMKLSLRDRPEESAAFGIPANLVKDFLEANGLLYQLPAQRLRAGVVHDLDWKGLHVELPDGMADESQHRLTLQTGRSGGAVSFLAVRFESRVGLRELEGTLLGGGFLPGFVPAQTRHQRTWGSGPARALGSAWGTTGSGEPFRVEYTVAELGSHGEKVAARFLGPPQDVAFNLSLLRRALETMSVDPLLTAPVRTPLKATFETAALGNPVWEVPIPAGWSREPVARAACGSVPATDNGIAASPMGDFTVVLRVLRWRAMEVDPATAARACGQPAGTPELGYACRGRRVGVDTAVWGTFQRRGNEVVLLEAEAPQGKLPLLADLYVDWVKRPIE